MKRSVVRHLTRLGLRVDKDEGLTLLETLVAIIVIALTVSAITPAFILTVATRVQSQRAEQAMQLARSEVDKVRLAMELGSVDDPTTPNPDDGDRLLLLPADAGAVDPDDVAAPTTFVAATDASCSNTYGNQPGVAEACAIEISCDVADADCDVDADFAVQVYRVNSFASPVTGEVAAFQMGVRVYAYEATRDENADGTANVDVTLADPDVGLAGAGLTTNPRNRESDDGTTGRSYRYAPLAVIYTTVFRGEEDTSLCDYYRFLGEDPVAEGLNCI